MPAAHYWFSATAMAVFIPFVGSIVASAGLGYSWYLKAVEAEKADADRIKAAAAAQTATRAMVFQQLREEYIRSNDGLSPALLAGREHPPEEWFNVNLEAIGANWRVRVIGSDVTAYDIP